MNISQSFIHNVILYTITTICIGTAYGEDEVSRTYSEDLNGKIIFQSFMDNGQANGYWRIAMDGAEIDGFFHKNVLDGKWMYYEHDSPVLEIIYNFGSVLAIRTYADGKVKEYRTVKDLTSVTNIIEKMQKLSSKTKEWPSGLRFDSEIKNFDSPRQNK
jgi:hypothetical protein